VTHGEAWVSEAPTGAGAPTAAEASAADAAVAPDPAAPGSVSPTAAERSAGHAIVEQLLAFGIARVFAVPGESYLDVLDGLYEHRESIDLVITRQEGGAAMMAAAHGQLTGSPGICMVTRGPGATNASIGVHVAGQDASPMVLFIGQVPTAVNGRRAFQEVDYRLMFAGLAKEVVVIDRPERATELTAYALTLAVSGEPGPVVVVLPEDTLVEPTTAPVVPRLPRPDPQPAIHELERAAALLAQAHRPLVIAGSDHWDVGTARLLAEFGESSGIPVATVVRRQHALDNDSEAYVGTLGLNTTAGLDALVQRADVVLLLGARPDGLSMANADLLFASDPGRRFIHVYPSSDVIGRIYPAHVGVVAKPGAFLEGLANLAADPAAAVPEAAGGQVPGEQAPGGAVPEAAASAAERAAWLAELRANYLAVSRPDPAAPETPAAAVYMDVFNRHFDADTVMTVGAGDYAAFPQRYHRYRAYPSQVASQSGSMGFGVPAATAAALALPGRQVVCFAGDGCLLMNGQELATIARYGLNVLVVLVNNSRFGTIRRHQDGRYPGRVSGTDLVNPDFIAYAGSFGARTARVGTPEEFDAALAELATVPGLRFVEVVTA
jgi:acetolactate synthase-1/2/3 large subunit